MTVKSNKRNIFQRLFGIPVTPLVLDAGCWSRDDDTLVLDLERVPELIEPGRAIRLESPEIPERLLIVHDEDGRYHAFRNRCTHAGRRLDPVPGTKTVQCCSVSKSTFDYTCQSVHGPGKDPVQAYPVRQEGRRIRITLTQPSG